MGPSRRRAQGKLPKTSYETLPAFTDTRGGLLIVGLNEEQKDIEAA